MSTSQDFLLTNEEEALVFRFKHQSFAAVCVSEAGSLPVLISTLTSLILQLKVWFNVLL